MAKKEKQEKPSKQSSTELISERRTSELLGSKIFRIILFVIVAGAIALSAYFFIMYQREQTKSNNLTGAASAEEIKRTIEKVGKLIELPSETPTVATVSDINKLKDQPFFTAAKNGDRVLIYTNAGKAILYRPSINKIVNVGPVNTTAAEQTQGPTLAPASPTQAAMPKIVILNGTTTTGLTKTAESKLKNSGLNVEVADRDNAKSNDYNSTIIIDLTGKNSSIVDQIIKAIGGAAGSLPKGETAPKDIDILIILGADFAK